MTDLTGPEYLDQFISDSRISIVNQALAEAEAILSKHSVSPDPVALSRVEKCMSVAWDYLHQLMGTDKELPEGTVVTWNNGYHTGTVKMRVATGDYLVAHPDSGQEMYLTPEQFEVI
jgi:hypothetical protein